MSSKLNISAIVVDHFATLVDSADGSQSYLDILVFYGLPTGIGLAAWVSGLIIQPTTTGVVATSLSVFAGLLLNLLLLLHTILSGMKDESPTSVKAVLVRQLHANISYGILVSVLALVMFLVADLVSTDGAKGWQVAFLVGILAHFVLTLCLVLKRTYLLVDSKIKK